ncbi:MAG: hypothetical protein RQM90_05995 [Methanoculleus sp.]
MREHRIEPLPTVKAVLCGSENLYPWQRDLLAEAFGCRVFSWYGNSEQTALAGECEESTHYHIFPEYGVVELIGRDGRPVEGPGVLGEVVATSLTNYVCPLIRYRTRDVAVATAERCSCGRQYPLLEKVEGRLQEFIVTRGGHLISVTPINYESGAFENIRQFQMYQETMGEPHHKGRQETGLHRGRYPAADPGASVASSATAWMSRSVLLMRSPGQ